MNKEKDNSKYQKKHIHIKENLSNKKSKLEITFDIDTKYRLKRILYLEKSNLTFEDEVIKYIKYYWNKFSKRKNNKLKKITTLEIPFKMIEDDLNILMLFPNLETLIITDSVTLSNNEIETLNNITNIKKIYINYFHSRFYEYEKLFKEKYFVVSELPYELIIYKNIQIQGKYSQIIEPKSQLSKNIHIKTYDLNEEYIKRAYLLFQDYPKDSVSIELSNKEKYKIKFLDDNNLTLEANSTSKIIEIYNYLIKNNYKINEIYLDLGENTIVNYEKNKSLISNIKKHLPDIELYIKYDTYTSSYDEFKGLIASIKWYRKIIQEGNLSPTEKLIFAYDILKTFPYRESKINQDSRAPHRIIETGNIVCVGYSNILKQILEELDSNIKIDDVSVECFEDGEFLGSHMRNIVRIDDDKYNIHGIFFIDSTWDSIKDKYISSDYTALDLYRYFLIPAKDYKKTFKEDSIPSLLKHYFNKANNNSSLIFDESELYHNAKNLFNEKVSDEEIIKYLDVQRPTLEIFNKILLNVRLAEGYQKEEIEKEIEKVIRINNQTINIMNKQGRNIEFLKLIEQDSSSFSN